MADRRSATTTKKAPAGRASQRFTAEERAAMKEYARERKKAAGRGASATRADGESDVLEKIAEMPQADRAIAERIHAIVAATAPELVPRTWYGMPAYSKDGNVLCFFQSAQKFKSRYAMLGFSDKAKLDEGSMWPTYYAVKALSGAEEKRIVALIKRAVS